jgi:DNA-directed RNA polymerase specialized sigma24 family protein
MENVNNEYAVKVTVRNALILRQMKRLGIKSQAELAERAGLHQMAVSKFITLSRAPKSKITGDWIDDAFSLSSALGLEPEELWTETQQGMALKKNSYEFDASEGQIKQLSSGEDPHRLLFDSERSDYVKKALSTLTPREQFVIRKRFFDGDTLRQVGLQIGTQQERVRQIEAKALRKLKHPAKELDKYLDA